MNQFITNVIVSLPTFGIIVLLLGMVFILGKGADILVDQAVNLSKLWGIPQVIIGATIISLGTTLPEVTVSVTASLVGNTDISLGNATGSVICNATLILGTALLIRNAEFKRSDVKFNSLLLLFSAIGLVLISIPYANLGSLIGHINYFWSFPLLAVLAYYIYKNIKHSKNAYVKDEENKKNTDINLAKTFLLLVLALVIVVLSSKILLPSAVELATRARIPQSIIAATLVAFGTSLPEVSTAIGAARKGNTGIALGNVIGANVLNILFVVGGSLVVNTNGINVSKDFFIITFPAMLIVLGYLTIMLARKSQKTTKLDGFILLAIYILYLSISYLIS